MPKTCLRFWKQCPCYMFHLVNILIAIQGILIKHLSHLKKQYVIIGLSDSQILILAALISPVSISLLV